MPSYIQTETHAADLQNLASRRNVTKVLGMEELSLVTGGAGFIGSHLVEALTAQGKRVRVLDDFGTGLRSNLAGFDPVPEIIAGDVSDPTAVQQAMAGVEVVFHLAALASVQRSLDDP